MRTPVEYAYCEFVCCCEFLVPDIGIAVESHLKWDLRSKDGSKTQNRV